MPSCGLMAERETIASAIHDSPNLGVAARRLGVARKTLYNRMRQYGMPHGKSGRPRIVVVSGDGLGMLVSIAALFGAGWLAGRWWKQRNAPTITGASAYLHGTDVLGYY